MRAIILAAGRGSRLRPFTDNHPKCFTELDGIPLLERQIATLRAAGVNDIWIVTGYRREMIQPPGTRQCYNSRWAETNMVESLFCMAENFGDDLLVSYSDIVYEPRVLDSLLSSSHPVAVVVDNNWRKYWEMRFNNPLSDAETLKMDGAGRIIDIGNPAQSLDEIEAQYIGLMRFQGEGVKILHNNYTNLGAKKRAWMSKRPISQAYITDLLMEMILRGESVWAAPVSGGWLEFDNVNDIEIVEAMLAEGSLAQFYDPKAIPVTPKSGGG
ncbi:MAG: phosphocholine cytidylyltransferase family protein [Magnetococcales bacterium]|nr:phosphocholine cytidylyltransferase family protein [Magnetococcales bacterium]